MANLFVPHTITLKGLPVEITTPWVMGILNVTPDSFYGNSRCNEERAIVERIHQIINEGAQIIDIGGYSSRPGAEDVSPEEEYNRLAKALAIIKREAPDAIVSIDTFRANVARRCVENWGADIINDISGGNLDENMAETVASLNVPYVLMHMRGTPQSMNSLTDYHDITTDVIGELTAKVQHLKEVGVKDIIIDPGFGFSKTLEQNYKLMARLEDFHKLELPLLVGISRKSMIYKLLESMPETALNGTSVLNTIALMKGAHILRVHDIKEAIETIKIVQQISN